MMEELTITPGTWGNEPVQYTHQWYRRTMVKAEVTAPIPWHRRLSVRNYWTGELIWPWDAWRFNPTEEVIEEAAWEDVPIEGATEQSYTVSLEDSGKDIFVKQTISYHRQ